MTHAYNLESEVIAEIERLEREARDIRGRAERAAQEEDKRILNRQAEEVKEQISCLLPCLS